MPSLQPVTIILLTIGILLIILALLWQFGSSFFPLGKLPGDIRIEKENFSFYFPITTSILISIMLTILFLIIRFFAQK